MEDVVVMGCGLHPFGRWPDKSVQEMGRVAIREALDDANVEFKDIQVAYTGRVYSGMGAGTQRRQRARPNGDSGHQHGNGVCQFLYGADTGAPRGRRWRL